MSDIFKKRFRLLTLKYHCDIIYYDINARIKDGDGSILNDKPNQLFLSDYILCSISGQEFDTQVNNCNYFIEKYSHISPFYLKFSRNNKLNSLMK